MTYPLTNKAVLITGAAGGLGQALCAQLLEKGCYVMATDVDHTGLENLAKLLSSSRLHTSICDITHYESCTDVVGKTIKAFGGIDLLINNAGVTHFSRFHETDAHVLNSVIDINLKGAINITHASMKSIIDRQGFIVGISSVAGFSPLYARSAYSASKHGLAGLMETLRGEGYENNVKVLNVFPGFIQTQDSTHTTNTENTNSQETNGISRPGQATTTPGKTLMPVDAAMAIINAVQHEKRLLHLGSLAKGAYWLHKISPWLYEKIMLRKISEELNAI